MAEPGWFADPDDPSRLRYWDGDAWTDNTAPAPSTPPVERAAPTATPEPRAPSTSAAPTPAAEAAAAAASVGPTDPTSSWDAQQSGATPAGGPGSSWGSSASSASAATRGTAAATPRRKPEAARRSFSVWPILFLVALAALGAGAYVLLSSDDEETVPVGDVLAVFTDDGVECDNIAPEMTASELASETRLIPAMLEIPPEQITAALNRDMMNASAAAARLTDELPADGPYDLVECSGSWVATDGESAYVAVLGPQGAELATALEGLGLPVEVIQ